MCSTFYNFKTHDCRNQSLCKLIKKKKEEKSQLRKYAHIYKHVVIETYLETMPMKDDQILKKQIRAFKLKILYKNKHIQLDRKCKAFLYQERKKERKKKKSDFTKIVHHHVCSP